MLFKPRMFAVEKDKFEKYNYPDSLHMKTKGYQWYVKNTSGESGKILKIKNPENKYTVSQDFNLGEVSSLWAVSSSSCLDGSRLQDRARERLVHRACPAGLTFDEFVKMRTCCWILEEVNQEFLCDCLEGSKGRICQHAVGMNYFVGKLQAEEDVRAVPLGGKRKRGRPKRNPHCLTRSPPKPDENVPAEVDQILDVEYQVSIEVPADHAPSNSVSDLHLALESDSESDDESIRPGLGNPKPPKRICRLEQISPDHLGSGREPVQRRGRGRPANRGCSRGRVSSEERRSDNPMTLPVRGRGRPAAARGQSRGRPRGSSGVVDRVTAQTHPLESVAVRGRGRGRPRGSRGKERGRARGGGCL